MVSFQFPIQWPFFFQLVYCGRFQSTIHLLSSEYADASKGTHRTDQPPGRLAAACTYHAPQRLSVSYIIYALLHNLASFYVSYVFARGLSSPFPTITDTASTCHSCTQPAFHPEQRRPSSRSPEPRGRREPPRLPTSKRQAGAFRALPGAKETRPLSHPPGHPLGPLMDGAGTLKLFKLFIILTLVLKRKNNAKINGFAKL